MIHHSWIVRLPHEISAIIVPSTTATSKGAQRRNKGTDSEDIRSERGGYDTWLRVAGLMLSEKEIGRRELEGIGRKLNPKDMRTDWS
jgi:pyrroloquinoline quinone (PQQ) biosynthesis protein C